MFSCTFIRPTPRIRRTPRLPRQDGAAGPFMRRGVRSARALLAMLLAPAREPTAGSAIRGNMTSHVAPRAISSCLALRGDGNAALAGSFNARAAWASPFHRRAVSRAPSLRRARSVALAAGESAPSGAAPTRSLPRIPGAKTRRVGPPGSAAAARRRRRRSRPRSRSTTRCTTWTPTPRSRTPPTTDCACVWRRWRRRTRGRGAATAPRDASARLKIARTPAALPRSKALRPPGPKYATRVFPRWLARRTSCPCARCPTCSRTKRRARGSGK